MRSLLCVVVLFASSGCSALVALGLGAERSKAHVFTHDDTLADGSHVVYSQRKSEHPRATVVLVHGLGANRDHWTRFIAALPDDVDAIALDLPGFGESSKDPAQSYDIDTQAKRLHAFVQQRGLAKFHLMGNSMGGQVAAVYALAHPERVQSLVLFAPAGVVPSSAEANGLPLVIRSEADFDAMLKGAFVKPPNVPGIVKPYFVEQAIANADFAEKVRADLRARPQPLAERIAAMQPPTLVVWGDTDRILDVSGASIWRAHLVHGDVVVLPQTGHAAMLERPSESAALVMTWWRDRKLVQ